MIVPISFQFSKKFGIARGKIAELLPQRWVSCYETRPASLFDSGISVRSTIVIGRTYSAQNNIKLFLATTETRRWRSEYRTHLFDTNQYAAIDLVDSKTPWPRIGHSDIKELYESLVAGNCEIGNTFGRSGPSIRYRKNARYSLSVFVHSPPAWDEDGEPLGDQNEGELNFRSENVRDIALMLLSGRLGYWWWLTYGDGFNVTAGVLKSFPIVPEQVEVIQTQLLDLAESLCDEQPHHPIVTWSTGKVIGNYDLNECRHITDHADQLVLDALGISHLWPAVLLGNARSQKATRKGASADYEWPFQWVWQGQLVQPDHWS